MTSPEKPGSFKRFLKHMGRRAITEFNYRYATPAEAHIFVGVKLDAGEERGAGIGLLRGDG